MIHILTPALAQIPTVSDVVKKVADFLDLSENSRVWIQTLTGLDVFHQEPSAPQKLKTIINGGEVRVARFTSEVQGPPVFCKGAPTQNKIDPSVLGLEYEKPERLMTGAIPDLFGRGGVANINLDYEAPSLKRPNTLNPRLEVADADIISFPPSNEFLEKHFAVRFDNIRYLSKGGCAYLFQVRDIETEQEKVIKVFNPDTTYQNIVHNELRFHEGACGIFLDDGFYYLVMDYQPLGSWMDYIRRPSSEDKKTLSEILIHQIDAVLECHRDGVVHNDIGPDNIFADGKLFDYGLAHLRDEDCREQAGKPSHVAPELMYSYTVDKNRTLKLWKRDPESGVQHRVENPPHYLCDTQGRLRTYLFQNKRSEGGHYLFHPSFRTDQYSLGVTLIKTVVAYWLVNESPFLPSGLINQFKQACSEMNLANAFQEAVLKAIAADPFKRHPNIEMLKADVEAALQSSSPLRADSGVQATQHQTLPSSPAEESGARLAHEVLSSGERTLIGMAG